MKVLVTGISGFTGGKLAEELVRLGHEVHGFARLSSQIPEHLKSKVVIKRGDLTDATSIDEAVRGMDVIYHVAALYRDALPYQAMYAANVLGTQYLAEAALKHGVKRFVHCSTVGVHGHIERPPANETAPFAPGDDYQKTKLEAEQLVSRYMQKGLNAVIFRPVGIYGPGDKRFLKLFKTIQNGTFIMFGSGEALYHLTYIDDLIHGILRCGEDTKALSKTYIIAGPRAVTLNQLVEKISNVLQVRPPRFRLPFGLLWAASVASESIFPLVGMQPPLYRRRADWFRKDRSFDASKISSELSVVPRVDLDEGLQKTADWYRQNQWLN